MARGNDERHNENRKPKRIMRNIGHDEWPHYIHRDVLIYPNIARRTKGVAIRGHGDKFVKDYSVNLEFDEPSQTVESRRTFPFPSIIQAAKYIDKHFEMGATAKEERLFTRRENVAKA